ncbi:MAG: hypothetical protein F6K62_06145 [Sphaerospermopsis sp. SIO1G2]|nr:hypothetical protein [Sphaerospermopsis sp. SIO1G2]
MSSQEEWRYTQKVIRVLHNRKIAKIFKNFKQSSDISPSNGQAGIRASLLIRKDDSALQVMNKQLLLSNFLNDNYIAIPDSWLIRPEHHKSQAVYQFREISSKKDISLAPKYPITIPHHVDKKPDTPKIPPYTKGNWETIFVLKDNSKIILHTSTQAEGDKVLAACKSLVKKKYLEGAYLSKSGLIKFKPKPSGKEDKRFNKDGLIKINVEPRIVKFWSEGRKREKPDWVVYFD